MLIDEMELASRWVPGLVETFSEKGLMELEEGGSRALRDLFRERGRPDFLVPRDHGGGGGSLFELAHVLRLVGARSPSLALMMTMHHHSLGAFARGNVAMACSDAFLTRVVEDGAIVASGFAEGRPGADILDSTVECIRLDHGGYRVTGVKRPCCMSHHADAVLVGVAVPLDGADGAGSEAGKARGLALVDRALDGVRAEDSWPADLLAASDSNSLILEGVEVAQECVLAPRKAGGEGMMKRFEVAHAEMTLSCLFQLTVSASYLGVASRLCELVLERGAGSSRQRLDVLARVEAGAMALYRLAQVLDEGEISGYLLARSMVVAHDVGVRIEEVVTEAVKALGGGVYLTRPEVRYLVLASKCLSFHPPTDPLREEIVDNFYGDLS